MNHEMTFSFLFDICIPCYSLHLELRHGLNFRTKRTSCFHGGKDIVWNVISYGMSYRVECDIVWNVISSNIADAQSTENTKFFTEGRGV